MKRKTLFIMAAAFALAASAQENEAPDYGDFTVDAQVRAQGDFRTGTGTQSNGTSNPNLMVNDRVRLSFGWERKNISLKIAAQHTGLWQDGGQKNTAGNITLHEAWARMNFGKGFFAQAGRQELSYDDERLLGAHDWAASGRAHDALRLGWENERNRLHVIVSFNQTGEIVDDILSGKSNTNMRLYKNMQTLWYRFGRDDAPFRISALFNNQGVSDANGNGVNYMQTFGTYMDFAKRKFFFDASLYYQTGRDRSNAKMSAFLLGGNLGWQFSPKWRLTFGDDFLSGSDGRPGTNNTFNLLYGSYHKFLGSMDLFGYGSIPTYGLNDVHISTKFCPKPKFDMGMTFHWFMTPNPIKDYLKNHYRNRQNNFIYPLTPAEIEYWSPLNGGEHRFGQNLGSEVDFEASYRPWKNVTIDAGFSMLIGTETVQLLKNADANTFQSWGWVCLNIDPTIFSTRHKR